MSTWRFVLADQLSGGEEIMDLESAFGRSYSRDLIDGSTASFTMLSSDPDCQVVIPGGHDIIVYQDGNVRDRLRITSAARTGGDDSQRTFSCVSYKQMLDRRKIYVNSTAATSGYGGIDFEEAAWNLINGAFGIQRAGVPTGRVIKGVKYFEAGQTVREALDGMAQSDDTDPAADVRSWEWDIVSDGLDLVFYAWAYQRGKMDPDYYFDNRANVINFDEDFDFTNFANFITVQGSVGSDTVYVMNSGGATAGTFYLSFNGYSTNDPSLGQNVYQYPVSLTTFQNWLENLPSIGEGNIEVTGPDNLNISPYKFTIKFTGDLAKRPLPPLTMVSTLTGGTGESLTMTSAGSRYTARVFAPDYDTSPYGQVEYYHLDESLTDVASVDEKAAYLLRTMDGYKPSYTFDLMQDDSASFDIGDYVIVDLRDIGYAVYREDLRVSSVDFSIGDEGDDSISVVVETPQPVDTTEANLARRVAASERAARARHRASLKVRQKQIKELTNRLSAVQKAEKVLRAERAKLVRYYSTHGDRKIRSADEVRKVNSLAHRIDDNLLLQRKIRAQIQSLK